MISKYKYLLLSIALTGCAKFVPPTGGERDVTPPKLIDSKPQNKTTNFLGKTIWLKFDEYVDSKDLKQELIMTPEPDSRYKVKNKGEEIILEFENSLDSNTTYTFNFGSGIKDINERNKSDRIKLVFSTGDKLDSLEVSGKVESLFTKEPVVGVTVSLYDVLKQDTINLPIRKPTYFVKTDSSGMYEFENLKKGKYRILAFKDDNKNVRFDNKKELFGFKPDTLNLTENTTNINFELYPFDTLPPKYKRYIQRETTYTLKFDEFLYKPTVEFQEDSINYIAESDEIRFFKGSYIKDDSIKVSITVRDSLSNISTINHQIKFRSVNNEKTRKSEVVRFEIEPKSGEPILQGKSYKLKFDYPIVSIDTSKIKVSDDTLQNVGYKIYYTSDSKHKINLELEDEITATVIIKADQGAFVNINSDSTTEFTVRNPIIKKADTGLIAGSVEVSNSDSVQYIFQLIDYEAGKVKEEYTSSKNEFIFNDLLPKSYLIRIIIDENFNGLWDTARFKEGKKPERVIIQDKPIKVKANFEFRDIVIKE